MVFNVQMQVQLLLLQVEQGGQAGEPGGNHQDHTDAVLGVAAMGELRCRRSSLSGEKVLSGGC